ncbi:hypothetical protein NPIL_691491, partial [Nephila pilipes]
AISKENLNVCELELKLHPLHTIENSLRHLLRLQIEHRHQKSNTAQRRLEHRQQEPIMTGTPESTVNKLRCDLVAIGTQNSSPLRFLID